MDKDKGGKIETLDDKSIYGQTELLRECHKLHDAAVYSFFADIIRPLRKVFTRSQTHRQLLVK